MSQLPIAVRQWWRQMKNLVQSADKSPMPMQVYRVLLREGDRNIMMLMDRGIAPNHFLCEIIPSDSQWQNNLQAMLDVQQMALRLTSDLKARDCEFLAPVTIQLVFNPAEEQCKRGERITVAASFAQPQSQVPSSDKDEVTGPFEHSPFFGSDTDLLQPIARIRATTGELKGRIFSLKNSPLRIGRDPKANDLVLPETDLNASRTHATLTLVQEKLWQLKDHSRNGVYIKRRVTGASRATWVKMPRGGTTTLTPGSQFKIGGTAFECLGPEGPAATRALESNAKRKQTKIRGHSSR